MFANSKKNYLTLLAISLTLFVWSLWRRPVHVDDAWIAEYVYWFSKLGYVKSEGMRGFLGAEEKLYIYHKLFVAEGAAIVRLLGFNIYVLKSLSLLFAGLCIFPLKYLYKKYSISGLGFPLFLAVFVSFFHVMNLAFTYRPEVQLVFLGLISFVYLDKYFEEAKTSSLVISALLTAIAIGFHLNGMIYTGAGVLLLWCHRKWKAGFFYGMLGALGLVLYVTFDVRSLLELQQLVNQFRNWRDVATASYGWITVILRPLMEQQRFLHSPPEIIYSAFLLFLIVPARKFILGRAKRVLLYAGLLTLCLAEIAHGTNTNYLIYAFPFFALLGVMSFEYLMTQGKVYQKTAWIAVAIFLSGNWGYNLSKFKDREYLSPEYQKVTDALPKDVYVLAPGTFVMQGLGRQKIQILVAYRDKVENKIIEATPEGLFTEAAKFDNEYVIFGPSDLEYFKVTADEYPLYVKMAEQPSTEFQVFRRRK